jgi:light-harvesting protein B-800-850 alpha chain
MADTDGQGGVWLVVPPQTGLVWLFGAVAATAFLVHAVILGHTKWFPAFMEGGKGKVAIEHVIHNA